MAKGQGEGGGGAHGCDERPTITARPTSLTRRRAYPSVDEDLDTRIFDPGSETAFARVSNDTRVVTRPQAQDESTCVLDESMLQVVDAEAVSERPEPSRSGACSRRPPRLDGSGESFAGRELGGYRVLRGIASGGMANVLLGRKEGPQGTVEHAAIKVVHGQFATERAFLDMFLDEARIASCIEHRNVVQVKGFGNADGTFFLALEYVHGETWGRLLGALRRQEGAAIPAAAAYVIAEAALGLHAAHTAVDEGGEPLRIVHRDISPDNLLVGYDGAVRVLDFGVAHAEARLTNTRAGILKGRLAYMAPEQAKGQHIDARADVWSLGVLLREALEGRRLFRRDTEAHTIAAVTDEPLPEWMGGVPRALRAIVDRALDRDVDQRFSTAREMADALHAWLEEQPGAYGTTDLSHLMQQSFSDEQRRKRAWLSDSGDEPVSPSGWPSAEVTLASGTRALPPPPGAVTSSPELDTLRMLMEQVQVPARRGVDRSSWLALVAALLALAIVLGLWAVRHRAAPARPAGDGAPAAAGPAVEPGAAAIR